MIIEISDGKSGIVEYLQNGLKKSNILHRDKIDDRIVLHGDLDVTDRIIKSLNYSSNYKHITLSFKEDFISEDDLENVVKDFKEFFASAFNDDEYNFYAEAHIPKIKTIIKNGETVTRKPHIHIIIPNYNLVTQKQFRALGYVKSNIDFINAWQESINIKYNFATPKKNRRVQINSEQRIMNRVAEFFSYGEQEKQDILQLILDNNISTKHDFEIALKELGNVKIRNKGKINEYFNIKFKHRKQGLNLKDYVFTTEFLSLSLEEKYKKLIQWEKSDFIEKESNTKKEIPVEFKELLSYWKDIKSLEDKYINTNTKFYKETYKFLSKQDKIRILKEKEKQYLENVVKDFKEKTMSDKTIKSIQNIEKGATNVRIEKENIRNTIEKINTKERKQNNNSVFRLSEIPMVYDRTGNNLLLPNNAQFNIFNKQSFSANQSLRYANTITTRQRAINEVQQIQYNLKQKNFYKNLILNATPKQIFENTKKQGGKKFKLFNNTIRINNKESKTISINEYLHYHLRYSEQEINFLKLEIEKSTLKLQKGYDMKKLVKINIKTNEKDKNIADYVQIGTQDVAGRFTGMVVDKASEFDTARAYVIDDKIVSLQKFKDLQKNMYEEILNKQNELFNISKTEIYNDKLRCEVVKENYNLTKAGNVYANSQFNFNGLKALNMGITKHKDGKNLDKNFFQIAKEFITAKNFRDNLKVKVDNFKQKVKAIVTDKPDLAATNVLLASKILELEKTLEDIKTVAAANEVIREATNEKKVEDKKQIVDKENEKEEQEKPLEIKDVVKEINNVYKQYQHDQEFNVHLQSTLDNLQGKADKNTISEISHLYANLNKFAGKQDLFSELINKPEIGTIEAVNTMIDNNINFNTMENINQFIDICKKAVITANEQNINPTLVVAKVIENVVQNQQQNEKSQGIDRD